MRFDLDLPTREQGIVQALLDHVEAEFPSDVAIVACYGSMVRGNPTPVSDLDLYFIPKTEHGLRLSLQFVIQGIGYDLWPLSWARAGRIAAFEEPLVSILADAQLAYCASQEDLGRFRALQATVARTLEPGGRGLLLDRIRRLLLEAKAAAFDLGPAPGYQEARAAGDRIVGQLVTALTYLNSTYPRTGLPGIRGELDRLPLLPEGFVALVDSVIRAGDPGSIARHLDELIWKVEALIRPGAPGAPSGFEAEEAEGFYEELRSTYTKIYYACDRQDYTAAYFAVNAVVRDVKQLLGAAYGSRGFADVSFPLDAGSCPELKEAVCAHERQLLSFLGEHGVPIREFLDVDEFGRYLEGRQAPQ